MSGGASLDGTAGILDVKNSERERTQMKSADRERAQLRAALEKIQAVLSDALG
jgi:hypothetical protein